MKDITIVIHIQTRQEFGLVVEASVAHIEGMGVRCLTEVLTTGNTEDAAAEAARRTILKLRSSKGLQAEMLTYEAFTGVPEDRCYYPEGKAAR